MRPDDPRVWIHAPDCGCTDCSPYRPAEVDRLTWVDLARLALLGLVAGIAAAMILDPVASAAALVALAGVAA